MPVSERSAMRNATFNRAVTLISGTVGMLPVNLIEKLSDGRKQRADGHPVQRLLRVRTNKWQEPGQFKSYMQGRALLHGNAYAFKVPGLRGVQALVPMDPCRVQVGLSEDYDIAYTWTRNDGTKKAFRRDEVLHLRAPWSSDGITGDGLLRLASESLGLAHAADMAAARLLRNGSYVGGALKHPKHMSVDAIQRLRQQLDQNYSGPENAGRWMVLEEGMDAQAFGMSGRDAQGLEQRKHQAEEISRFTGVPRPLLMFDETSWGSGIEQLGLFFVTYCLLPWFTQWEEAVANALLTEAERERYIVKFNEAALLRGSLKDQAEFLAKALGGPGAGGYMLPDEARDKFDMNPLEDGLGTKPAWLAPETTTDAQP
ncbi:HK97 family phage portal protein [Sphingomonas kaistensis]|uniref:HK97 family phage portal protein n=1 Tax=Sphingomonas kaistensis TaxID=298708 RepID=A0A7X5Y7P4_9SPHN|nr:phage portal protein [Sphingomonas kaistensis]NJC06526.1 HK97 family phage portal protein [Sphingomonas kaistensis]